MDTLQVGPLTLGAGRPCVVIAEAGVNHNGSLDLALALVDAAADAGADAVKFQTAVPDLVVSPSAQKAEYQRAGTAAGQSQLEMVRQIVLPPEAFSAVKSRCERRGLVFLSTPFDLPSLNLLVSLGVAGLKIASGDLVNPLLLEPAALTGLPLIVSTGMADLDEVDRAVGLLRRCHARFALMQCTSAYPARDEDMNLAAMETLRERFGVPVGLSDHSEGTAIAIAAAALGACVIEKHFTLDRGMPGPDHQMSLTPSDLAGLVRDVRRVWHARGDGRKRHRPAEDDVRVAARRSLFVGRRVSRGTTIERECLAALRPGGGIPADRLELVVGRKAARDLAPGDLLAWDDLTGPAPE